MCGERGVFLVRRRVRNGWGVGLAGESGGREGTFQRRSRCDEARPAFSPPHDEETPLPARSLRLLTAKHSMAPTLAHELKIHMYASMLRAPPERMR